MQTIYSTKPTSNFSIISNSLINSAIPAKAQKVLLYLLSKPSDWKLRVSDLKHRLGLSTYSVRQALRWLMANGYAYFERLKSGFTNWFIYDSQSVTRMVEPRVEIPRVENQHVLPNTELLPNTEHNYTAPIVEHLKEHVVASVAEEPDIPLPDSLKGSQAKAASKLLRNVTPEQAAMILVIFNAAQKSGKVQNPIGYLHSLIKAAQEGTLTTTERPQQLSLDERIAKQNKARDEAKKRLKIDNSSFFEMMRKQYGERVQVPM